MGDGSFNSAADRGCRAGEFIDKSPGQMGPQNRLRTQKGGKDGKEEKRVETLNQREMNHLGN